MVVLVLELRIDFRLVQLVDSSVGPQIHLNILGHRFGFENQEVVPERPSSQKQSGS